jgi:hypothetical protein
LRICFLPFPDSKLDSARLDANETMKRTIIFLSGVCALSSLQPAFGWDYEGHRLVNQLALASLPKNFPAFVFAPAAQERLAFLSGEADRWRNMPDLALRNYSSPDHYIDLEELPLYGLKPETLPPLRYDFVRQLAIARAAHPEKFPPIDPTRNMDHTRELVGFLPWTITEYYVKLKSEFSYLKAFEEAGGTPEEITNAQANIIYIMGVMGHFVGDAAQPLHTTIQFNGWTGDNPNHYTTGPVSGLTNFVGIHAWIDGGYIAKVNMGGDLGDMKKKIRPAQIVPLHNQPVRPDDFFQAAVAYIEEQNKLVEPLYKLEKEGKLTGEGEAGLQGKPFIEGQLVKAGQMLGDIWFTAWQQAPVDTYLERQLQRRQPASASGK